MKSVGVFVQQSNDKVFSLCWESDLGGNSSSKTWYAQALQALSFIVCISAQVITIHTLKYSRCVKKTESCNQNMKLSAVWTRGPFFVRLDGSTVITWLRRRGGCQPDCYRTYIKYYCSECRLRRDETETEGKRSSYYITVGCSLGMCLATEHVQFF